MKKVVYLSLVTAVFGFACSNTFAGNPWDDAANQRKALEAAQGAVRGQQVQPQPQMPQAGADAAALQRQLADANRELTEARDQLQQANGQLQGLREQLHLGAEDDIVGTVGQLTAANEQLQGLREQLELEADDDIGGTVGQLTAANEQLQGLREQLHLGAEDNIVGTVRQLTEESRQLTAVRIQLQCQAGDPVERVGQLLTRIHELEQENAQLKTGSDAPRPSTRNRKHQKPSAE